MSAVDRAVGSARRLGTIEPTEQVFTESHHGSTVILRREVLLLGKGSYALTAGQSATILVGLTGTGRHALAAARHRRPSAMVSVSVTGGTAIERSVVLSEPVHRRRRRDDPMHTALQLRDEFPDIGLSPDHLLAREWLLGGKESRTANSVHVSLLPYL